MQPAVYGGQQGTSTSMSSRIPVANVSSGHAIKQAAHRLTVATELPGVVPVVDHLRQDNCTGASCAAVMSTAVMWEGVQLQAGNLQVSGIQVGVHT